MQLPKLKYEDWIAAMLFLGVPLIAIIYFDWRAGLAAFILIQCTIGILKLRNTS